MGAAGSTDDDADSDAADDPTNSSLAGSMSSQPSTSSSLIAGATAGGLVILASVVAAVFLLCRNKGGADHMEAVAEPYGGAQRGIAAGGGQPKYANPVYAHHANQNFDNTLEYAEVLDVSGGSAEVPYEEPSQHQSVVYDTGGALGAQRQCIQITPEGRCSKLAAAGLERCSKHVCSKQGCTEPKSSNTKFCAKHTTNARQVSAYAGVGSDEAESSSNV